MTEKEYMEISPGVMYDNRPDNDVYRSPFLQDGSTVQKFYPYLIDMHRFSKKGNEIRAVNLWARVCGTTLAGPAIGGSVEDLKNYLIAQGPRSLAVIPFFGPSTYRSLIDVAERAIAAGNFRPAMTRQDLAAAIFEFLRARL